MKIPTGRKDGTNKEAAVERLHSGARISRSLSMATPVYLESGSVLAASRSIEAQQRGLYPYLTAHAHPAQRVRSSANSGRSG